MPGTSRRRVYDHRMRDLVCDERDPDRFRHVGVPRSTAVSWIRRGPRAVVSSDVLALDHAELQAEILALRLRNRFLLAIIRLAFLLVRLSGFRFDSHRLPDGKAKSAVLCAVAAAKKVMPTAVALRVLGLSASRFHTWRKLAQACPLEDRTSCPNTSPTQLTAAEVSVIGDMVTDPDHRHMPLRTLALYAQRIGKVFAAAGHRGPARSRPRLASSTPSLASRQAQAGHPRPQAQRILAHRRHGHQAA
jgi:hypothetical protein